MDGPVPTGNGPFCVWAPVGGCLERDRAIASPAARRYRTMRC